MPEPLETTGYGGAPLRAGVLAWRTALRLGALNLLRNRRRTLITGITVALAVLLLQFMVSLLIGIEHQSYDNLIRYQTGHAKVFRAGYFADRDEYPLDLVLEDAPSVVAAATAVRGVAAATPRITFQAYLSNGVDQIPVNGVGIQVAGSDDEVFRIPQAVTEGTYFSEEDSEGILLGHGLADLYEVGPGDWLTVLTRTRTGAWEALDMPVRGILGTGNPLIDRASFLLPIRAARQMLMMGEEATEVAIRFADGVSESATLSRLRTALLEEREVEVMGWREIESDFIALANMKRTGQGVFLGIFVLMAVVGIANTMLMATYERTREVGMLMAMGLRRSGIRRLFLIEGVMAGFLGAGLGMLIALPLIIWLRAVGIDLTAIYGEMDIGYPVKDFIYPALSIGLGLAIWAATGLLAAAASLYPAVRASNLEPAEALRHV